MVIICTAQWSLYVPHSCYYMYRTVLTIRNAQWSLCIPHSVHYMYRTLVTIGTTSLTFSNSTFCPHTVFICFVWISEQTAIISLYNINWLVCITETESVYCAVRTGCLNVKKKFEFGFSILQRLKFLTCDLLMNYFAIRTYLLPVTTLSVCKICTYHAIQLSQTRDTFFDTVLSSLGALADRY